MKNISIPIVGFFLSFAVFLLSGRIALADTLLYQTNTGLTDMGRWGNTDVSEQCQRFEGVAGTIDYVYVALYESGGTPASGTITLSIYDESGGSPSGTAMASGTLDAASLTNSAATYRVDMTVPFAMTVGETYCLRYQTDNLVGSGTTQLHVAGSTTGPPSGMYYDGVWNSTDPNQNNIALWEITTPSVSTSTTDTISDPNRDFFAGVLIFFVATFFMMWILQK